MRRRTAAIVSSLLALGLVSAAGATPSALSLHVSGSRLVDAQGHALRLLGVNRSSFEYACVQWGAASEGPTGPQAIAAIAAWHVNAVRVPLNGSCWLNRASYRTAVRAFVTRLHAAGMYAILDLHWDFGGQSPMADSRQGPKFWRSMALAFRRDRAVVFDLYNEPHDITWDSWHRRMQALVDAVRRVDSRTPLMVGGLAWANDLSGWLRWRPRDRSRQLIASFHLYNFTTCNSALCWDASVAPVARRVPVVTGELGEDDCAHGFIDRYMAWADAHGISYLGWTWNPWDCSKGPALISNWDGTPTSFGAGFKAHLAALAGAERAPH